MLAAGLTVSLRTAFDAVPVGLVALDGDLVVRFWNRTIAEWTGVAAGTAVGRSVAERNPALAEPRYAARLRSVRETGAPVVFSAQLHRALFPGFLPDGRQRIQHGVATFLDPAGRREPLVLVTVEDVSEATYRLREQRRLREQAEREVRERVRAQEAARRSEERYRSLFRQTPAGVCRTSLAGAILDCNPALARMLGFDSEEDLRGRAVVSLYSSAAERERLLRELAARGSVAGFETTMRRRDGTAFPALLNVRLAGGESEEPIVEGTVVDLSERQAMETRLRQAHKAEAVGRLAGGVAHDFNNLLTVIQGQASLVRRRLGHAPDLLPRLAEIERAAGRAAELTGQLLAYARRQVLRPRELDLAEVVSSSEEALRSVVGEAVTLCVRFGPGLGRVRADRAQVEQVLLTLAANARDAMPAGGTLAVDLSGFRLPAPDPERLPGLRPGRYVEMSVSDTGSGMPPEVLARAFEPFFTTKEVGRGSGLGLASVYGAVKQSGGFVYVESASGRGTAVRILLPCAAADEQATVLLVDDDPALRGVVREALETDGLRVVAASCGPEAVEVLEGSSAPVHLLLTDVLMPGMGGVELARRAREARPGLPVLLMSGVGNEPEPGGPGLPAIEKPFTSGALLRAVRATLAGTLCEAC
jgi:PAS domain S-box-containing protein